jgi:ribonuclease Z
MNFNRKMLLFATSAMITLVTQDTFGVSPELVDSDQQGLFAHAADPGEISANSTAYPESRTIAPSRPAYDYSTSDVSKVVMLGTGSPVPLIERFGPAVAIVVNDRPYLIDAGEGSYRASQTATPKYGGRVPGLDLKNLDRLFLTHHHMDHVSNLAAIIYLPWYLGSDRQLDIYGPRNTAKMVERILEAYQYVIDVGEVTGTKYDAPIIAKGHDHILPGIIYKDEHVTVDAFKVLHGNMPNSFSYKFTTPDRVIVVSGDKRPTPGFAEWAAGADILIHEVYTVSGLESAPARVPKIAATYHTSTEELAEIARVAKPRLLVLYHVQNYANDAEAPVSELRHYGYNGRVILAVDQDIY